MSLTQSSYQTRMAGIVGLEPTFQAPKTRVLTVGRYPNVLATLDVSALVKKMTALRVYQLWAANAPQIASNTRTAKVCASARVNEPFADAFSGSETRTIRGDPSAD